MLQGDFGNSYWFKAPVMEELADRIPVTVELTIMAMLISVIVAVPLGIVSALRPESPMDYAARVFTMTGIAMPTFLIAILLLLLLVHVGGLAPLNYAQLWDDPLTNLHQMIWPALALGFYEMGFVARVTRSAMMEIIREDYMRTARSKGLSENSVVYGAWPQERPVAGAHHVGLDFRSAVRRNGDYRDHFPGTRHGTDSHRVHFPAGLHDDSGSDCHRRFVHRDHQSPGGPALRLAGPPHQVRLKRFPTQRRNAAKKGLGYGRFSHG